MDHELEAMDGRWSIVLEAEISSIPFLDTLLSPLETRRLSQPLLFLHTELRLAAGRIVTLTSSFSFLSSCRFR